MSKCRGLTCLFVCLDFFSKTPDGVSEQTAAFCYFILVTCVKTLNVILTSGVAVPSLTAQRE